MVCVAGTITLLVIVVGTGTRLVRFSVRVYTGPSVSVSTVTSTFDSVSENVAPLRVSVSALYSLSVTVEVVKVKNTYVRK